MVQALEQLLSDLFERTELRRIEARCAVDNRASMHAAVDDYDEPRRMLRMIVGCTEKLGKAA